MFLFDFSNKYLKTYIKLCTRKKDDNFSYTENHHIFPKSIFGKNSKLVRLTAKEHFLAHLLLYKAYKKEYGIRDKRVYQLWYAIICMSGMRNDYTTDRYKISSRLFELLKKNKPPIHEDTIKKQTSHNKEYWSKLENRQLQSARKKEHYANNPEAAEAVGEHFRQLYSQPEKKEWLRSPERLQNSFHKPESRQKAKETMKAGGYEKSIATRRANHTPEQLSEIGRAGNRAKALRNPNWAKEQGELLRGRVYAVNFATMEKKVVRELPEGFTLWSELTPDQKKLFPKKEHDNGAAVRGKRKARNLITGECKMMLKSEPLPENWEFTKVEIVRNTRWIHNPKTKERRKIKIGEKLEDEWCEGRGSNNP